MDITLLSATPDPEETICKAARNDYMTEWVGENSFSEVMQDVEGDSLNEKKYNLLKHLISREHYGPLEHVHASFAIRGVSRVVMAQATRHRHLSFDIQSQRYCDFSEPEYSTPPSYTDPDHFTRDDGTVEMTQEEQEEWRRFYKRSIAGGINDYERMVEEGIPKEDARYALPTAMQVNMVMSGNLRALLHVVNMRSKADVQAETRELAGGVSDEIERWVPTVYELVEERMPLPLGL